MPFSRRGLQRTVGAQPRCEILPRGAGDIHGATQTPGGEPATPLPEQTLGLHVNGTSSTPGISLHLIFRRYDVIKSIYVKFTKRKPIHVNTCMQNVYSLYFIVPLYQNMKFYRFDIHLYLSFFFNSVKSTTTVKMDERYNFCILQT